ncbi:hypothetical protein SAMN04487968_102371 [Nocardioides terrae]|uniref:Uncharacterized protein n=1 Tax=Nocardioides terrae TaxID=574651 RepID=A0A1I1F3M2_9ACTN|nr:hypothetical protein [Nocardioides terrae]SFB93857.1 hypothetical protein SAMN04487968_102371 [Nocardioides terrae]
MPKTIPTKPPQRPFRPSYAVTTTARVPGRVGGPVEPDEAEPSATVTEPTS